LHPLFRFTIEGKPMKKLLMFVLLGPAFALTARCHAQVIVIAHPSLKASEIGKNELKEIFTGAVTTLKDGGHVVPILLNAGTSHEEFLKEYIGKSDSAYRTFWRSLVFSGQGTMPKSLEGDAAMVEFVRAHPGSIGYIARSSPHPGVKVMTLN